MITDYKHCDHQANKLSGVLVPSSSTTMSGSVLDQAMNEVSDKRWSVRLLPVPDTFAKEREVNNSIADFVAGVCRPLDPQVVKSVAVLFDSHVSIPEFASTSTLTKPVAENNVSILPSPIQFAMPPPNTAKVEIIVDNSGDGFVSVLKIIYFEKPVPTNIALKLCSGHAHVPVFRQGPWTVKKGIQRALSKVAGSHVRWHVLEDKHEQRLQRSASAQWSPEDDELSAGIRYINEHAPECDGLNEQTYWILTNIKTDSGSPVAGWPEVKVRSMCQNKSRGVSGAVPQMEFPLTTYSLRLPFVEHVLPLIYPLLMSAAILMLGTPGVGKTPAIIAMCMAIGRYHVRRLQLQGVKPGWRRAKSLDNFRQRAPQIQEALFLDDPSRRRSDIADLKAFFTSDEDGTVSGRYNDARTARNQMRAMASNDSGKEPSDVLPSDTTLNSGAFFELINPLFHDDHIKDILAVMKRVTTLVFTDKALYIRFPSEQPDAIVHRVVKDNLYLDLLGDRDKGLYASYKQGTTVHGPTFVEDVQREQAMIDSRMEYMNSFPRIQDYVKDCNDKLQEWLRPVRVLEDSPDSPENAEPAFAIGGLHLSRHIGTAAAPNRIDRSRFNFGDSPALKLRRLRSKSPMPFGGQAPATPIMPASSPHDPDQDAGDEMDIADPANEHEMEVAEGDEDAARFLHG